MRKLYYSIAVITALLSFSFFIEASSFSTESYEDIPVEHIDMSEYQILITATKKGNE
jgi:hypothetical protein